MKQQNKVRKTAVSVTHRKDEKLGTMVNVAELFSAAANFCLRSTEYYESPKRWLFTKVNKTVYADQEFSCLAIQVAEQTLCKTRRYNVLERWMKSTFGLDTSGNGFKEFDTERQQVRYAWLMQVARVAEEENLWLTEQGEIHQYKKGRYKHIFG